MSRLLSYFSVFRKTSKQARTNLALASNIVEKSILIYNLTMTPDDQIIKLVMTPSSFRHTFLAIVTTDGVPTHDDFFRTGNGTVKLIVCIENGLAVNESLVGTCDSPGIISESTHWGYLFNGRNLTIVGSNEEGATEDVEFHVGSIALVGGRTEFKTYLKEPSRRSKRSTAPR